MLALTLLTPTVEHAAVDFDFPDVSSLWRPSFPTPELVSAAAGLLTPLPRWDGCEGPRRRLVLSAGTLRVASTDPARADRAYERQVKARTVAANLAAQELLRDGVVADPPARAITSWSARSRSRMVERLAQLDYTPLFAGGGVPGMVTLTYPGDWLPVAPDATAVQRHLRLFRKRYARAWGHELQGVWKREFQRRGAPHIHILMVPPRGEVNGENFSRWLSRTWAEVVNHPDLEEFRRHQAAGTGVDYAEGMRQTDPRRLAVYFSKHGAYADKEYQNVAPPEWVADGKSVGRFWGYWHLEPVTKTVEVSHVEAYAAARTLRRWSRANGYVAKREVWRAVHTVDVETGEVVPVKWKRRRVARRSGRMPGHLGFVTLNDGPAYVSQLVRHLDAVRSRAQLAELVQLGYTPREGE